MVFPILIHRLRWLHAPATLLVMLLQRTPVLRLVAGGGSGFTLRSGELLKSAFALAALGAYDTVAGATNFNATKVAPTTVTPASGNARTTFNAAGDLNTAFSLSFTGSGAPSTIRSWKISGTLPSGLDVLGATSSTSGDYVVNNIKATISGTPTVAGPHTLTVTAYSNNDASGHNARVTCTITINGAPAAAAPAFTLQPISQTVNPGTNVTFTVAVTGNPTPTLQWFKDSSALPGQTAATLALTGVTAADIGAYKVVATNSASPAGAPSASATLTVNPATTPPKFTLAPAATVNANYGSRLVLAVEATGTPTPTLQWRKDATSLPSQTAASLVLDPVALTDAGAYSVVVTNSAGSATATTSVAVVVPPPILPVAPTGLKTGSTVDLSLAGGLPVPAGLTFKATTLPAGLALDPATGRLTGVLTAKPGAVTITTWTQVGATKSANRTLSFAIADFPASFLGGYEALLDSGAPDHLPVGKLSLNVAAGGAYTGQLIAPDLVAFSLKGSLALSDGDLRAGATPLLPRPGGAPAYALSLSIADPALTGEAALITTLVAGTSPLGSGSGARLATTAPTKESITAYTLLFADPAPLGSASTDYPLGSGWATATINATGTLTLTGQTADATKLTATLALGADATYRLYAKPYAKLIGGYLAGPLTLSPRADAPARRHVAPAGLIWFKPQNIGGFGPLALAARLEPWINPAAAALAATLGLPTSGQFSLGIDAAGLVNIDTDPFGATLPRTLKLDAQNLFSVVSATTPANPTAFTAKLNLANGALTGGFTVPAVRTVAARKVTFTGVVLQPAPADRPGLIGGGFFLLPATAKGGPAPSGAIELATP